jgi:hypothetical protein
VDSKFLVVADAVPHSFFELKRAREEGWKVADSKGTEATRLLELVKYDPGEEIMEQVDSQNVELYLRALKDHAEKKGDVVHEVICPFDTAESMKAAADAGSKTPQQQYGGEGYVAIDQTATKGVIMVKYKKGESPAPPQKLKDILDAGIKAVLSDNRVISRVDLDLDCGCPACTRGCNEAMKTGAWINMVMKGAPKCGAQESVQNG